MRNKDEGVPIPDDGTETEAPEETTIKVSHGKRNGATNGAVPRSATQEQIATFKAAIEASGREINVARVHGPGGKDTYLDNGLEIPVQCADCPEKLPPESAGNIVAAIRARWGGGIYRAFVDGAKPGEILYPIKVPGKPKPLDEEQADEERETAERKADEREAREVGGVPFGARPAGFGAGFGAGVGAFPPPRPGFVYDPTLRQHVPITPFQDPSKVAMEKELADLRRKVELDPLQQKIAAMEERAKAPSAPSESPFKGVMEMLTAQQQEAARERAHQLAMQDKIAEREASERKDKREREDAELKARTERDREELKAQRERDRDERQDRDKDRQAMLDMVIKLVGENSTKRDPMEMLDKVLGVAQGVKELNAPQGKSEQAETIEAIGAVGKDLINSTGEAVERIRGGGKSSASGGTANPPATDENSQLLDLIDYVKNLSKSGKISPAAAFTAVYAYCQGRGYDAEKMMGKLGEFSTREKIAELLKKLKEHSESTFIPADVRPRLKEAHDLLGQEEKTVWLLELSSIAKGPEENAS